MKIVSVLCLPVNSIPTSLYFLSFCPSINYLNTEFSIYNIIISCYINRNTGTCSLPVLPPLVLNAWYPWSCLHCFSIDTMIPETLRLGVVNNTGMRLDKRAWTSGMRFPRQTACVKPWMMKLNINSIVSSCTIVNRSTDKD